MRRLRSLARLADRLAGPVLAAARVDRRKAGALVKVGDRVRATEEYVARMSIAAVTNEYIAARRRGGNVISVADAGAPMIEWELDAPPTYEDGTVGESIVSCHVSYLEVMP